MPSEKRSTRHVVTGARGRTLPVEGRLLERWLQRLDAPDQRELRAAARQPLLQVLRLGARLPDPEAEARLDRVLQPLASRLVREFGLETALRALRDDFLQAVAPAAVRLGYGAAGLSVLVAHLGDACWRAHAAGLGERLQHEEMTALQKELAVAKRIQERLLPRSVPDLEHFEVAGRVLPAREVGGDYWSCKWYAEDRIATFKLADVTGHGVAAALLVAAVKFISGGYYRGAKSAAQVIERTNHVLVKETPHEILVTMVYGWLSPTSRAVTLVNAGHSPLWVIRGAAVREIAPTGPALGLMEVPYGETRVELAPNDLVFTCSDGVTDARGPGSLGEGRVREIVLEHRDRPASEIRDAVLREALAFYETPIDDMTVVVVRCVD